MAIHIEAQPIREALRALGEQAGLQILFRSEGVAFQSLIARRVAGEFSAKDALEQLLGHTGLQYEFVNEHTVRVTATPVSGAAPTGEPISGESVRLAQSEPADLEEVVVRGVQFRFSEPSSATKLLMDPRDIPQSVTLVTEDVMDFASIKRFDDIYRVDASSGSTYRQDGFPTAYFRGFYNQGVNTIRIDGFRFIGNVDLDLVGFERFEVVKGPASALFGQNTIGGTLNAVTKQPMRAGAGSLRVEGGSHDLKRAELDLTGPIDAAGRWQYRLIGAYEDTSSYLDYAGRKSTVVVPSLAFDLSEQTRFLLSAYYNKQSVVSDWGVGLQAVDPDAGAYRLLPVSRSHFYGQPWNHTDLEASIVTLKMDHRFNDDWSVRIAGQRNGLKKDRLNCSTQGNPDASGRLAQGCFTYLSEEDSPLYAGEINVIGNFELLGRRHTLLVGADYAHQDLDRFQGFDYIDDEGHGLAWGSTLGYNVSNPLRVPKVGREDLALYRQRVNELSYSGITAQLLLHATDRLSLLLASRYNRDKSSRFDQRRAPSIDDVVNAPYISNRGAVFAASKTVWQAGVTYAVRPETNLYANWGQTYEPVFGLQFDPAAPDTGKHLAPEQGEQVEIGMKTSVLDRLSLTVAAFDMKRRDISQGDTAHPGFSAPVGTQRSRGFELGASGELLPGWELFFSATLLDSKFIAGEFEGVHAANAPKRAFSVFTSYQIPDGPLRGFGAGLGYVFKDGLVTYGVVDGFGSPVRFDFGTVRELDLRLFYRTGRWEAFVSGRNLFNGLSYAPSFFNEFRSGISVNPARSVTAGITYKLF